METVVGLERGGIVCTVGSREIYLDPRRGVNGSTAFVSHAHMDHLPPSGTDAIASKETRELALLRGVRLGDAGSDGMILIDSGHILGSRGLLVGDVFYTGDICTRGRAFMRRANIPRCKTLIIESTFGLPEFSFPNIATITAKVNRIISAMFARGRPVILMGNELGKAQVLTHMFSSWDPLYAHNSVKTINDAYRRMGVDIRKLMGHTEAESRRLLDRAPWVMVAPMHVSRNPEIEELRSRYGAVTVAFSGWSGSAHPAARRGADYLIQMSDHCDFGELLNVVRTSGAKTVYTTHGFADEFCAHLRSIGVDAHVLSKN